MWTGVDAEQQSFVMGVCCKFLESDVAGRRREAVGVWLQATVVVQIHIIAVQIQVPCTHTSRTQQRYQSDTADVSDERTF